MTTYPFSFCKNKWLTDDHFFLSFEQVEKLNAIDDDIELTEEEFKEFEHKFNEVKESRFSVNLPRDMITIRGTIDLIIDKLIVLEGIKKDRQDFLKQLQSAKKETIYFPEEKRYMNVNTDPSYFEVTELIDEELPEVGSSEEIKAASNNDSVDDLVYFTEAEKVQETKSLSKLSQIGILLALTIGIPVCAVASFLYFISSSFITHLSNITIPAALYSHQKVEEKEPEDTFSILDIDIDPPKKLTPSDLIEITYEDS
jgi:tetrahydromethanopterin S-methyltransferase subunit G